MAVPAKSGFRKSKRSPKSTGRASRSITRERGGSRGDGGDAAERYPTFSGLAGILVRLFGQHWNGLPGSPNTGLNLPFSIFTIE
jgi:hypothetical protein